MPKFDFSTQFLAKAEKIYISSSKNLKKIGTWKYIPMGILFLLIVSYVVIFTVMTVDQHDRFNTSAYDLGMHDQQIWQHSRFLNIFNTVRGMNPFGDHFFVINILISPIYWLFDDVRALLILQVIALAAAAVPLFLIARHYFKNDWVPLIICFSYLMFPALHWGNFEQYHTEAFIPFFILFAFYFIINGKTWPYLVFFFLALTVKEDISLNTFLLGLYIYFKHDKKVGIVTSVFSLLWFFLAVKVFIPFLGHSDYLHTQQVVGHFGSRPMDVFFGLLEPKLLFRVLFNEINAKYIWEFFYPVAFLAFLNPQTLIISASLWVNLISDWPYTHDIRYHYVLTVIPFIFVSIVLGIQKFEKKKRIFYSFLVLLVLFPLAGNYHYSPFDVSIKNSEHIVNKLKNFRVPSEYETKLYRLINLIPKDASVSAYYSLVPHLTHRASIYMFPNPFQRNYFGVETIPYPKTDYVDYLLLRKEHIQEYNNIVQPLIENGPYQFVAESDDFKLFKKQGLVLRTSKLSDP